MKKLLLATVLVLGLPAVAYGQSDDVKLLMHQEEELNSICRGNSGDDPDTLKACDLRDSTIKKIEALGWCWGPDDVAGYQKHWIECKSSNNSETQVNDITILPAEMYISNTPDSSYPPDFSILYDSIVNLFKIKVVRQELEFWILLREQKEYPENISAKLNNQLIQFTHIKNGLYRYKIHAENTKTFVHDFTSSQTIEFTINNQKIILSLNGSTKLFNDFIAAIEEKHISLPPPFKYFEDSPLNNKNFDNLPKPNGKEIADTSIQQAFNTLNQVDCNNIADNLVKIVSSCYRHTNNLNANIDICLSEDELSGYWLAFTKTKQKLLQYNDFFSEKNFSLRKQKYMFYRFDTSLDAASYYDKLYNQEIDLVNRLNNRCTIH